jgi:OFA family oxalate/formate antiporter-like MFS transporter
MTEKTASPSTGWIVTLAGVCINLALGVLYTWSIFTAKFTTVVTVGVGGVVQKTGEKLTGAAPILASKAAEYGIKVPEIAAGKPAYGASDYVGQLDKATGVYKVSKVGAIVFHEGAYNWAGTDALLPYALALLFFGFTMIFAGRLQDKYGPRLVATVGGVFVGVGMIIASFSEFTAKGNHLPLTLGFGVLTGMGIGLAYACATPAAVKWFHPSKRGLISGIVVAGFGLASVYTAPLTTQLITSGGLSSTFRTLGIAFLISIVLFAQLLKNPPAGYEPPVPAGFKPPAPSAAAAAALHRVDYTWQQMVKTPQFYLLWTMYAFAAFAGLMMIGVIAKVAPLQLSAEDFAKMALTGALAGASLLVVALAIGNGAGRPVFGIISDKIGRVPSMIIAFLAQAALVGFLLPNAHDLNTLLLWSALIGCMYGACLTLFPAATYDFFGTKNGGVNYGLVFSAWGVGGALGNYAIGWIYDASGKTSFNNAYYLAAGLLVVAAIMAVTVKAPKHAAEDREAEHISHATA